MHERSLVGSLIQQVEALRVEQQGLAVEEVQLEIGPLAGVESLLVQSAFSEMAPLYNLVGAQLIIDDVPLTARCANCGIVEVPQTRIACPCCGSSAVRIVGGDEVRLKSVTIRYADEREATR